MVRAQNDGGMTATVRGRTLAVLLREQAERRGERTVYTYLADGEHESDRLTFAQLDRDAQAIAARIRRQLDRGDRALILMVDGLQFIRAFLGCQYANVIAVPASLPFPLRSPSAIRTLNAIVGDCQARLVLSDAPPEVAEPIRAGAQGLATLPWLCPGDIAEQAMDAGVGLPTVDVHPQDVSFLQYTSGSTSLPKGVVVTHEALLHNEALIGHWLGVTDDDVFVVWLPLFHDMGLIGNVLQALHSGAQSVLMPPLAFVQRPERWLQAISRYGGTISGGPNFAYDLCTRRVREEDCEGLDLSSWRWAFNGAEPVRSATLSAFADRFRRYGLDRSALAPCYGLAEHAACVGQHP
jgi:acyl-CoA synthetase (AMP-forming)/AMP-acid ligase II